MRRKRCPDCDRDGEVHDTTYGGYKECPRCEGTKQIDVEGEPGMSEDRLFQFLMIGCASLAAICGLGAVGLLILCAASFSMGVLVCSILLAAGGVGAGYLAVGFASRAQAPTVFNNQDEKEVLTGKQRKVLKTARGEVVMERALVEIEHERDNIVHRQIEAAEDPNRPPHQTRWTDQVPGVRQLRRGGDGDG